MTAIARNLLRQFDSLEPAEKRQIAGEILRRSEGVGPLPDAVFDELAADLLGAYDREEESHADRQAR